MSNLMVVTKPDIPAQDEPAVSDGDVDRTEPMIRTSHAKFEDPKPKLDLLNPVHPVTEDPGEPDRKPTILGPADDMKDTRMGLENERRIEKEKRRRQQALLRGRMQLLEGF